MKLFDLSNREQKWGWHLLGLTVPRPDMCGTSHTILIPNFLQTQGEVPKSQKLNISFFFLLTIIMCIEMLHLFQRVESIRETQAGPYLENQNIYTRYTYRYTDIQDMLSTHSYLICVWNAKDTRCKIKIRDTFLPKKWSLQAKVLSSL